MTEGHHEDPGDMQLAIIGDPAEGWAAVGEIVTIILWEFGAKIRNRQAHGYVT